MVAWVGMVIEAKVREPRREKCFKQGLVDHFYRIYKSWWVSDERKMLFRCGTGCVPSGVSMGTGPAPARLPVAGIRQECSTSHPPCENNQRLIPPILNLTTGLPYQRGRSCQITFLSLTKQTLRHKAGTATKQVF